MKNVVTHLLLFSGMAYSQAFRLRERSIPGSFSVQYWSTSMLVSIIGLSSTMVQSARSGIDQKQVVVSVDQFGYQEEKQVNSSLDATRNESLEGFKNDEREPPAQVRYAAAPMAQRVVPTASRPMAATASRPMATMAATPLATATQQKVVSAPLATQRSVIQTSPVAGQPVQGQTVQTLQPGQPQMMMLNGQMVMVKPQSAPAFRRGRQKGLTLLMSDVDDTATCPAAHRGEEGISGWIHDIKADFAGFDRCTEPHEMEASEIYFGYGLFLYLLGTHGNYDPRYVIVSANPGGTKSYYSHIGKYVKLVSDGCKPRMEEKGLAPGELKLNHVRHGRAYSSLRGHVYMAIRKLHSMVKETVHTDPDKVVWIGDTGQGDVCAGVCFIDPAFCKAAMPKFVEILATTKTVYYEVANAWVHTEGQFYDMNKTRGIDVTRHRYALFHHLYNPLENFGIESQRPIINECLAAGLKLAERGRVGYFKFPEPVGDGYRRQDYKEGMIVAANMNLLRLDLAVQWWAADCNVEKDWIKSGVDVAQTGMPHPDSMDCMTQKVYREPGYRYRKGKEQEHDHETIEDEQGADAHEY